MMTEHVCCCGEREDDAPQAQPVLDRVTEAEVLLGTMEDILTALRDLVHEVQVLMEAAGGE